MLSIIYNRQDSYLDFGLVVVGTISKPSTNPVYETYNIPGRRGTVNEFQYYGDNEINVNFGFKTYENITAKKSKILNWLNSNSNELVISDDKSIFYKVNKVSVSGFDGQNIKNFSVTFSVDPFTYLQEGNIPIELTQATSIYNVRANVESNLYLKIYGVGDITVNINSQSLILKNVSEYIEVDSDLMDCFKKIDGQDKVVHMNDHMYSAFPVLNIGENIISWSGNVEKILIIPRWCCR